MARALILLALLVGGCSSMAWPVNDATTIQDLEEKRREQLAAVNADRLCVFGDPLRHSYSAVSGCERLKSQVWWDYWRARRTLSTQKGWK